MDKNKAKEKIKNALEDAGEAISDNANKALDKAAEELVEGHSESVGRKRIFVAGVITGAVLTALVFVFIL